VLDREAAVEDPQILASIGGHQRNARRRSLAARDAARCHPLAEGTGDAVTSTSARASHIAAFYTRHADHLHRTAAADVNAPAATIEDDAVRNVGPPSGS
jgi:hypothetical protein